MVFKRFSADHIGPHGTQRGKEFLWVANPGKGQQAQALPRHAGDQGDQFTGQIGDMWAGSEPGLGRRGADGQQQISASKARGHGFAQGTSGQDAAITKPALGVDHDDRQVFFHRWVLKTIIQQNNRGARRLCCLNACGAVARDPSWCERRQQQRFVPGLRCRMAALVDANGAGECAAKAAGHDMRGLTAIRQDLRQRHRGGRFARTADVDVADADHRDCRLVTGLAQAPRRSCTIDPAQRCQKARAQVRRIRRRKPELRCTHL